MKKKPDDIKQIEDRIMRIQEKERHVRKHKPESEYSYATKTRFRIGTEQMTGL